MGRTASSLLMVLLLLLISTAASDTQSPTSGFMLVSNLRELPVRELLTYIASVLSWMGIRGSVMVQVAPRHHS